MKPVELISTGVLLLLLGTVAPMYAQQEQQQEAKPQKQEQEAKPEKQQKAKGQQGQQQKRQQEAKGQQEQQQKRQQEAKGQQEQQQKRQQEAKGQQEQQQKRQQEAKGQQEQQQKQRAQQEQQRVKGQQEQQQKRQQEAKGQQEQQQKRQQEAKGQQEQQRQQRVQQEQQRVRGQQEQQQRAQQQRQQQASQQGQRVQQAEQRGVWQQHRARSWEAEHRTWQQRGGYNGYRIPEDRYRGNFGPDHSFRIYSSPVEVYGGRPRFQYGGFWFSVVDPWPEYWSDDWYENDDVYIDYSGDGYYLYNRRHPGVGLSISVFGQQGALQVGVWQRYRARSWRSQHRTWRQRGGYNGYRIPEDRFRSYFGPDHSFRIYSSPVEVYGGRPRFQYGGFWFSVVDPWPEYWSNNWYENDDVYIDYSGDGYYLYNRRHPRDRIAIRVYVD